MSAESLDALERALALNPTHAEVLIQRAYLLYHMGRREEALASADRAVLAHPEHLQALNTRGMLLDDLGRREDARADFEHILTFDPDYADAITNRAIIHARSGEFQEALAAYDRSLTLNPDQINAIYNRAVVRLVLGDWTRGFREFESRWKLFPHEAQRLHRLAPQWDGRGDIRGKTVLLHHEQGYGDTLQLCRYVIEVGRRGAHVVIAVPAALRRLVQTLPGSPQVISESEPVPQHDLHCPLMSLPLAFGTTPGSVPARVPYLRADPDIARRWQERLGPRGRCRIGLVWSGRRYPPINHVRDMSLERVSPLLALDAEFYCLHAELSEDERSHLSSYPNLRWFGDQFGDFADTAGLIANLDLVITVDTAAAHLSGALGKPVWLMNRYASCWRWLLKRSDSPWYPSLRLFRQPALGDWTAVVNAVCQAGAQFIANRRYSGGDSRAPCDAPQQWLDIQELLQEALRLHHEGCLEQAIALYRRILAHGPGQPDALHYLGVALAQNGRALEALDPLAMAVERMPSAAAHSHYGNALAAVSRFHEAIASYDRAIACDPAFAEAHYNRGIALTALHEPEAALASYDRAIECHPVHVQAHNNRGILLMEAESWDEALEAFDQAISIQSAFADPLINRSHLLRRRHRYEEALESANRALTCSPNNAEAHNSRGAALAALGRFEEALQSYDQAIALQPSLSEAVWNKGLIELANGDFINGWTHYESRWSVRSLRLTQRYTHKPRLRHAESVVGKTILLHSEQGYGDTLQFSRYASVLAARGARVVLCVPPALKQLFVGLPELHEIVTPEEVPAFDLQCPLLSLPAVCGTELSSIPTAVPYLRADQTAAARWARELGPPSELPRIGLAWCGRITHQNDPNRSIPLEQLVPITDHPARWISLQKEVRATDESCLASTVAIHRYGEQLVDFADTAALMTHLDLIITVDTSVAHLAGALGKPVWILLPHVADWRWLRHREDSPWYPTARLWRQSVPGDWRLVLAHVLEALQGLPAGWPTPPHATRLIV